MYNLAMHIWQKIKLIFHSSLKYQIEVYPTFEILSDGLTIPEFRLSLALLKSVWFAPNCFRRVFRIFVLQ